MAAPLSSAEALWQDYAFLTRELAKFAGRQSWNMVMNLLDQRASLQQRLDELADRDFVVSPAGRKLLGELLREEQAIARQIRLARNQSQQRQQVALAYDAYSAVSPGMILNRGT
ncbi:MAG: hypothetical protein GYA36_05930 [Veillonellaceae bacterium]|nr:hypothetical protein [Veillonellaceae bacterium]